MSCAKEKRKRSKNTNNDQYELYLQYMESDYVFRSGTINPTLGDDYLENKWKDLCCKCKLNALGDGPNLTVEEWRKRFLNWKYATRSKYRKLEAFRKKTGSGPESDIKMTNLEERGLGVWGKVVVTGTPFLSNYDGLSATHEKIENENLQIGNDIDIAKIPIFIEPSTAMIAQVNSNEEIVVSDIIKNVPKPQRQKSEKIKIKPQPLAQIAEKLIQTNKESLELNNDLTFAIKAFSEKFINIEKEKVQIEKNKLQFEIAKYQYENKDFKFDLNFL